ncbi:nucleotidyltransferase domain-containing protein [Streptomyces antimicrobicus]|uniref:Nucleotidyltransferase domain-containing protein n=1 Tax=Streptomyces antimicrobicus TaxID=2883108 RepID=A0ABS8B7I6_9ACTN|nr:nucleotidyltransferase domain-containing protein [Streptomyces antimicrobicus]MCB5180526.1 nucleotidyltransferase domain-containing protein [Streptomyces antimicrobicus]
MDEQTPPARHPLPLTLVRDHTVYSCVMGSRAFGLATEASDTDRRGVYLAPTPLFWRFEKPPTHVEGPAQEQFSWELERFCELALKANPTILECLHSPLVEVLTPVGEELLDLRGAFLSRRAHASFSRYARSQWGKLEADVRAHGAPRWKHAMHLLRLLLSCRDLLRTGRLSVDAGPYRTDLLAVRRGERGWDEVTAWTARLSEETEAALRTTTLPAEPDRARVADFLLRTRRASAEAAPA